jgi:hypothetical protein
LIKVYLVTALLGFTTAAVGGQHPVLSLVIDDIGYSLDQGQAAIKLEGDHTFAIIPGASNSQKLAAFAHRLGKEIILHLPLQSATPTAPSESNALHDSMDENQLTRNMVSMLSEFPDIRGINNHMGSHLTEIDYFMRPIMDSIRTYNPKLYFLDSRTTPRSIAYSEAISSGLRSISRDVFLDNQHTNIESIRLQYQIWLEKARERGSAVAIGHPHATTIEFLRENLPQAAQDFRFMRLSRLIEADKYARKRDTLENYLAHLQNPAFN